MVKKSATNVGVKEEVKKVEQKHQQTAQEILNSIKTDQKLMDELNDDQRDVLIADFNEKNKGIAELVHEKPDEDYVNQCKKDFEDYQGEYLKLDYEVCDAKHSVEFAKWLKAWNTDHVVAPANYWIGVLRFDEVIDEYIKALEDGKIAIKDPSTGKATDITKEYKTLTFDYGALTYVYNLMMQPVGVGIEYARWMAENQETYNAILNKLGEHIDMIDLIKKKIGLLQSRWALACSGFKMNLLIDKLEDLKNVDLSHM
jgi:hypothetical protein